MNYSGQGQSAPVSLPTLGSLLLAAKKIGETHQRAPLTILLGSGINLSTITTVLVTLLPLGLQEIHLSGGRWEEGDMLYRREGMGMGVGGQGEWGIWRTDGQIISEVRQIVDTTVGEAYHKGAQSLIVDTE